MYMASLAESLYWKFNWLKISNLNEMFERTNQFDPKTVSN